MRGFRQIYSISILFLLMAFLVIIFSGCDSRKEGLRITLVTSLSKDKYTSDEFHATVDNVKRRLDGLGITSYDVQVKDNRKIIITVPGETDKDAVTNAVTQPALLEFVDFGGIRNSDVDNLIGQSILTDYQMGNVSYVTDERLTHPYSGEPFVTILTGNSIKAAVSQFQANQWIIVFELKEDAAEVFGAFTAARIGEPLAIVLDGEVLSAPIIRDKLTDSGSISGAFSEEEARLLVLQLRSGALPIPLVVESVDE